MTLTILHAEDDPFVAAAVRDALEAEGWRVVTCADGAAALNKLAGGAHYDLLLTDNELPHVNGIDIARYARALPRHRHIPIVMFTASDCERRAREAGINVYLTKPDDIHRLAETVAGLLT